MGTAWRIHVVRCLALLALAVSATLLVHYVSPNPRLCGYESDCDAVLNSPFARGLGVSLPLAGVVGFAALFAATLFPDRRIGQWLRPLALAAGANGLILLLVQGFLLERLCRYCAVVDLSAVAIGVVQLVWGGSSLVTVRFRPLWLMGAVVVAGLGAAFGAAGGWPSQQDRPPPPQVTALWVEGKVNVVEVADFQCPHCRRMHAVVSRFLAEEGDRVHFVRLAVPMPAHPQARDAARAFRCAGAKDKGDLMAEELFRASDLSPATCEGIAARLGLSMPAFRGCVADPATDGAIDADLAWVKVASPRGLPVVWVQGRMLQGLQPIEALREAARIAERRRASGAAKED